jgi:hypothetical protein
LPFVTVALSVLVAAAVSAKHARLAITTSSMTNRMLVGLMSLDVVWVWMWVEMLLQQNKYGIH